MYVNCRFLSFITKYALLEYRFIKYCDETLTVLKMLRVLLTKQIGMHEWEHEFLKVSNLTFFVLKEMEAEGSTT